MVVLINNCYYLLKCTFKALACFLCACVKKNKILIRFDFDDIWSACLFAKIPIFTIPVIFRCLRHARIFLHISYCKVCKREKALCCKARTNAQIVFYTPDVHERSAELNKTFDIWAPGETIWWQPCSKVTQQLDSGWNAEARRRVHCHDSKY